MKRNKKIKHNIKHSTNINLKTVQNIQAKPFVFEKLLNVWALAVLIFIIGFFAFSKYLSGEYLFFFKDIGSDSINENLPGIIHKVNLLKEGFFSKWSFYKGMGDKYVTGLSVEPYGIFRQATDYLGANYLGANYFILGRFLKIFIFYFLLSGIVAFIYFRTLSIKKYVAFIGALLISFSGFMAVGAGWGFQAHIFKAIFLLFSFEQLFLKNRWYFFPFAIIWLSGNPFTLYLYSFFLLLYSAFRFLSEKNRKVSEYLRLAGKMIILGLAGILMNFSNFTKNFLKMYFSPRVAGNASYGNILSSGQDIPEHGNLAGTAILRFFSSDILGTGSNFHGWYNYFEAPLFYIGLITLLLLPQIFIHLNKRKKIVFASFLGFWMLTLIFPYLRYTILAFTGDYFRQGFDFFIPFTFLFFAVYALNEVCKTHKINIPLLAVTLFVLIVLLYIPYGNIPSVYIDESIRKAIVVLLIIYGFFLSLLSKPKYKTLSQIGILILVIFELSYFSYNSYAERIPVKKSEFLKNKAGYADGSTKAVNYIKTIDKTPFYRIEKDYQSGNSIHGSLNDAQAQGYYGTASYSSFNQLNYVYFLEEAGLIIKGDETSTRWITGFRGYPLLQTFGNVKYNLSKSENPEFLKFGFEKIAEKSGISILKNKFYLPFGYTYDKYITIENFRKLENYQISVQSLNLIYQDLSRTVEPDKLNQIIENLKPLLTESFPDYQSFSDAIIKQIGNDNKKYILNIAKYSVSNFKNQIALLNAFVYGKEFNKKLNLSDFKEITLKDTAILVSGNKFNFKIYKNITDSLKKDTFQITSFRQSEIKGKINISKTKMLFFSIPYDEGWKIKVNDKEEVLQKVNIGFTGIVLPKGKHTIELYYVPEYYRITNFISLTSILIFWLYLALYFYRKKRKI